MRYKPEHTCFQPCARCAYDLGLQEGKKKPKEHAKYVWAVIGSNNSCDIRRYAFSHQEAVSQLAHAKKQNYKDVSTGGTWTLFKLVQVDKKKAN